MDQPADSSKMGRVTVWHDGGCPLCAREIALMRRLDRLGRVTFIDARQATQCPADRTAMLLRLHAREDGGDMLQGAAAFAAMWRAIPVLRPLGLLARNVSVLWLLERCYRGFLRMRPALQRRMREIEAGFGSARRHDGA